PLPLARGFPAADARGAEAAGDREPDLGRRLRGDGAHEAGAALAGGALARARRGGRADRWPGRSRADGARPRRSVRRADLPRSRRAGPAGRRIPDAPLLDRAAPALAPEGGAPG